MIAGVRTLAAYKNIIFVIETLTVRIFLIKYWTKRTKM